MKRRIMCLIAAGLFALCATAGADSLYDPGQYRSLIADPRAFKLGDNLTVIITEFASITTTARTSTNKQGSVSGSVVGTNDTKQGEVSLEEDFSGGGRIERSGKLVAQLTVVVEAIEGNGDLLVKGSQEIELNNEKQRIFLEGRVRPEDIGPNNTVLSTRLSQATISYTGKGLLAEKQRPGVLTRFLSWIGLL